MALPETYYWEANTGVDSHEFIHVPKDQLKKQLNERILIIKFLKKSGESRTLTGTTDLTRIPENQHPKKKEHHDNLVVETSSLVTVFDLEANAWRSFDCNRVKEIKVT